MYKGYSIDRLKEVLDYNPDTGVFTSKVSKKELVDRSYYYRDGGKTTHLQLARVAVMFVTGDYLQDKDRVAYKDKDVFNLKYENLYVVPFQEVYKKSNSLKNEYIETEHEFIYVGTLNGLFVVRRGPKQAVYRTFSKEEAADVRDRWLLSGKTEHLWDDFTPSWYKKWLENAHKDEYSDDIEKILEEY